MLTIKIWDVQHGNAAYIKTPASKHIVQDLGTGSYKAGLVTFSPLLHLRNKYNINQVDEVIITHPHGDHLDDISNFDLVNPRILHRPKHLTDEEIWAGNKNAEEEVIEQYLVINDRYSYPVSDEENPLLPANNGGVDIKVFTPYHCERSNLNNHSLVTVMSYETCKIILPGDNESASWHELLELPSFRTAISGADVVLASHHGRDSGFCSDIFEYFEPKLTIISDGRFCDTSATSRYDKVTSGWKVHHRNGPDVERKCVTTRNDGDIVIKMGRNSGNGGAFISVTID